MREPDYAEFSSMLDAVCGLLSRGAYTPSAANTALFFRSLARHELRAVRAGFDAHVADPVRGRFVPVPADILAQIEGLAADDGRPGAEEAWATVIAGTDEAKTIVWTDEMAEAWGTARHVHASGDEIGARMAFKETYGRLVDEARRSRRAAVWTPSFGTDPHQRQIAIDAAATAGRLPAPERLALPAPANAFDALTANQSMPAEVRQQLLQLRDALTARIVEPSPDAADKVRTEALRKAADAMVKGYQAEADE